MRERDEPVFALAARSRRAVMRLRLRLLPALCAAGAAWLCALPAWSQNPPTLAAASAPAAASPASLSPEQQLQAVRDALLQSALAGTTRVRSTAWLNADGQLMEASQFSSEAQVRGVRVVEYLPATEEARVEAAVVPPAAPGQACSPRPGPERLQHPLELVPGLRWPGHGAHLGLAQESLAIVAQALGQAAAAAGFALAIPSPGPVGATPLSAYERAVYGREEPVQPLQLRLELSPASASSALPEDLQALAAQAWQRLPMVFGPSLGRLDVLATMSLVRAAEPVRWQQQVLLSLPVGQGELPLLRLQQAALSTLQQAVQAWWPDIAEQLRCVPLSFEARRAADGRFKLLAGGNAGLRRGDRLLLTDSSRIPRRILEAEAAEHLALVEVDKVGADRAEARQVAGPALGPSGHWVALPF